VFDTLTCVTGDRGIAGEHPPQDLADQVHGLWVRFATDGSLPWRQFNRETRQVYSLPRREAVSEAPMPAAPFSP